MHFCDLAPNTNGGVGIVAPAGAPGLGSSTHPPRCLKLVVMNPCQSPQGLRPLQSLRLIVAPQWYGEFPFDQHVRRR